MPISLHSHSGQFCKHATDTLDSVVQTAIKKKFISYGLSEHMPRDRIEDLYPEESGMEPSELESQFDRFILEASRLKQLHSSQINLLVGMETELIEQSISFDLLDRTLARHQDYLDYLVGSVHHVNQIPIDFDRPMFEKAVVSFQSLLPKNSLEPIYQLCEAYFDAQYKLIDRYRPEVIGHFDLCLLFHPDLDLQSELIVWNKIIQNIHLGISYGALFEVNSASLRKGWSTPYPSQPILKLIISLGGRLTLSDDSHGSDRVGLNYGKMYEYLKANDVETLWYLVPTQPNDGFRLRNKVSAVKIPGNWWDHPFWSGLIPATVVTPSAALLAAPKNDVDRTLQNNQPPTSCPPAIQLGSIIGLDQETSNSNDDETNQSLRWKNFPIDKFTNQTWFIISSSLPFWKNKKNATISYSELNHQPIHVLADLVEYHSSLTDRPSTGRKKIEGTDRPLDQGPHHPKKDWQIEDHQEEIVGWRWQGKGILRLLKSDWQLLGYHFSPSATEITSADDEDRHGQTPDWVITFFHKTLFTPAGIDIYARSPSALSDPFKLQLIHALQTHPSKVVSNLADGMFEINHDPCMNP